MEIGRTDLTALAAWASEQPDAKRPVAYFGATVMWPYGRRVGFEIRDRQETFWVRVEDWYLRGLLARWSRSGRGRLRRGHGSLRVREAWLSSRELQRRFGGQFGA